MSTPKRLRSSRIEDVNQRAFEDTLGEFFVYRELRRDIGVDGQVEVFDGDDTTGLTFDVQRRATDARDEKRARRMRLHVMPSRLLAVAPGPYGRSLAALERAWRLDAGYAERAHFFDERAGPRFMSGRYREAAEDYGRALELGARTSSGRSRPTRRCSPASTPRPRRAARVPRR